MSSLVLRLALAVSFVCLSGVFGPLVQLENYNLDQLVDTLKEATKDEALATHPQDTALVQKYNDAAKKIIKGSKILLSTQFLSKIITPEFAKDVATSMVENVIAPGHAAMVDTAVKENTKKRATAYVDQAIDFFKVLANKFRPQPVANDVDASAGPITIVIQ